MSEPSEIKFPKQIFLILGNEFCERFCYYGLRGILVLYIRGTLLESESTSKIIFHVFNAFAYLFPLLGAIVADSWMGKFKTIVYFSIIYILGTVILALSALKPLGLPSLEFCIFGLFLIATGTGGIKPCVSAFGGDQFVLPQQQKQLDSFFYFFYFLINLGSALSTIVTPELRDMRCFNERSCYFLGFGLPALLMVIATIILIIGKPLYAILTPEMNVILMWLKCVWKGIKGKITSREKLAHWLDHAEEQHGKIFVEHVKQSIRIIIIFLPIPLFWALFDQSGSSWILQANLMDGNVGDLFTILPEQMITANPFLILILIPLFTFVIYPLCTKCKLFTTHLKRMGLGGIIAGTSFFITAFVAIALEADAPILPTAGQSHIRIYNPLNCTAGINAPPYIKDLKIESMGYEMIKVEEVEGKNFVEYEITGCTDMFANVSGKTFAINEKETIGYFLSSNGVIYFKDDVKKQLQGYPNIRTLIGNPVDNMKMTYWKKNESALEFNANNYSLITFNSGVFTLGDFSEPIKFYRGGVYTILVWLKETRINKLKVYEVTKRNTLHMLWQIPQYVVLTVGEVLLSPTGLEFAYTQSPKSMKSVMTSMYLLAVSLGNLFVVLIEVLNVIEKPSNKFFLFGGLMMLDMALFVFLATRYRYFEEKEKEPAEGTSKQEK